MSQITSSIGSTHLQPLDLLSTPVWIWDLDQSSVWWGNKAALELWGAESLEQFKTAASTLSPSERSRLAACSRYLRSGAAFDGTWDIGNNGHKLKVACRLTPIRLDGSRPAILAQVLPDAEAAGNGIGAETLASSSPTRIVEEVGQLLRLLESQITVLELIGRGSALDESLHQIVAAAERLVAPGIGAILLVEPFRNALRHVAAVALPQDFIAAIDGIDIGPYETTIGAAVCRRKRVIARDIAQDPSWARWRAAALAHGLHACWAQPIIGDTGEAIGAFAIYYPEAKVPSPQDCWVVDALCGLAKFAIDNDRQRTDLQSANDRFVSLATTVPGVVYQRVVSPDGDIRYTFINEAVKDLFGVTPAEVLGNPQALFDCFDSSYRENFQRRLLNASQELKLWDVEASIIAKDGTRKFTHAIARPTPQPDGSVVWDGVILDATRIKKAEMEAQAAEAKTRETIIESIPQGLILFDEKDEFVICNGSFLHLYPFLADVAKPGTSYQEIVRSKVGYALAADAEGLVPAERIEQEVRERIEKHKRPSYVEEQRLSDGRWILINEHRTASGGTIILYTDVSELKEREAALERSNRELQDFASIASHDLQEPLRKIEAFGDRLRDRCGEQLGEDGKLYLDRMHHAAKRMRQLINDLLTYSRVTTKAQPFVPVALNQIVDEMLLDLQIAIETSGALISRDELPVIDADPLQMRLLFQNLTSNALKFRRPGEAPKIQFAAELLTAAQVASRYMLRIGDAVEIHVTDNGIGFEMKYVDRIFGIFQRLHGRNEYEGTGIGLATCRKICERHAGIVTAKSVPGEGSTFIIVLPVKQAMPKENAS